MIGGMERETPELPRKIDRSNDERIYQPRIHSRRIRELYQIGQEFHLPLTVIVDQALESYINQLNQKDQ